MLSDWVKEKIESAKGELAVKVAESIDFNKTLNIEQLKLAYGLKCSHCGSPLTNNNWCASYQAQNKKLCTDCANKFNRKYKSEHKGED